MLPCFTFTHKSKFTYSRTKIFNFTFSRQDPCFTHSRVKKFHFTFSRQKKGSRVHTKRLEPWHTKEFFSQILNLFTPKWQFYNTSNLKKILRCLPTYQMTMSKTDSDQNLYRIFKDICIKVFKDL